MKGICKMEESTTIITEEGTIDKSGFNGIIEAIKGVFAAIMAFFQGIAELFGNLFNSGEEA